MEIVCSAQHHIVIGRRDISLVHVEWWQLVSYMEMQHMRNIWTEIMEKTNQ